MLRQRSLFHVLHCFSMHCGECGYCQGMGPIAATLLCYLDAPVSTSRFLSLAETNCFTFVQRVFAMMVRIHDVYQMHSIFIHGFPGLLECFYLQERLIELIMPDVYVSLVRYVPLQGGFCPELIVFQPLKARQHDCIFIVCNEMVHHTVRKYGSLSDSTTDLGCVLP